MNRRLNSLVIRYDDLNRMLTSTLVEHGLSDTHQSMVIDSLIGERADIIKEIFSILNGPEHH